MIEKPLPVQKPLMKRGINMPKKPFASYERTNVIRVEKVIHVVRVLLNTRKIDILDDLKNVPDDAIVTMIIDESVSGKYDGAKYGEIVFEEQKKTVVEEGDK